MSTNIKSTCDDFRYDATLNNKTGKETEAKQLQDLELQSVSDVIRGTLGECNAGNDGMQTRTSDSGGTTKNLCFEAVCW